MKYSPSLLVSLALLIFTSITKSQLHASALLFGIVLWHTIFPDPPSIETKRHLPSRVEFLASLRVDPITSEGDGNVKEDCPACWEDLDERIRLVCGHKFCKSCILSWLNGASSAADSCPVCRRVLFIAGNHFSTREYINVLAHKLRICTAMIVITTTMLKVISCSWVLYGWRTSLMPLVVCTLGGGTSLWKSLDGMLYMVLSLLMAASAQRSFWMHNHNWHQAQLGGTLNIVATLGWLKHCNSELNTLSAISALALRKKGNFS